MLYDCISVTALPFSVLFLVHFDICISCLLANQSPTCTVAWGLPLTGNNHHICVLVPVLLSLWQDQYHVIQLTSYAHTVSLTCTGLLFWSRMLTQSIWLFDGQRSLESDQNGDIFSFLFPASSPVSQKKNTCFVGVCTFGNKVSTSLI